MINPVTGGAQPEAEIRAHLGRLRVWAEAYNTLDKGSGGLYTVLQSILALEDVLKGSEGVGDLDEAEWQFLKKNPQIKWNSGVPVWEFYELIDGNWRVTAYEVDVNLTNPRVKTLDGDSL